MTAPLHPLNYLPSVLPIRTVPATGTYYATPGDVITGDATSGSFAVYLPIGALPGAVVTVKLLATSGTNTITVVRRGTDVINPGATSATVSLAGETLAFVSDGAGTWTIAHGHKPLTSLDGRYATQVAPGFRLIRPRGLRRWRQLLGDALYARVPIVVAGDSTVYGVGGDDNNAASNIPDNTQGWVGQLRQLLAKTYGDPGEGMLIYGDSRIVIAGAATTAGNWRIAGPIKRGIRLLNGGTYTVTIPAGSTTTLGVVQANLPGDVTGSYTKNGGSSTPLTALTGTAVPITTDIAVTAGDVIAISGPATAQTYIPGVILKIGTTGVPVHRIGITGYTIGDAIGGQTSGAADLSAANQILAAQKLYDWAGTGLLIVSFGLNDQQFAGGGGTAAQNGITPTLYQAWLSTICTRATADGWCVLVYGEQAAANPGTTYPETAYRDARKAVIASMDHVAGIELTDVWGTDPAVPIAAGMQFTNSPHSTRRGHGDIARIVYQAITALAGEASVPTI